jgi:hypothetical protein
MSGTCSAYGGEESLIQGLVGNLMERNQLGDPSLDGKIILRWIFRKRNLWLMDWIQLA